MDYIYKVIRGIKFRQPADLWGVEALYNKKWHPVNGLYLRDMPAHCEGLIAIDLWRDRTVIGSAPFNNNL